MRQSGTQHLAWVAAVAVTCMLLSGGAAQAQSSPSPSPEETVAGEGTVGDHGVPTEPAEEVDPHHADPPEDSEETSEGDPEKDAADAPESPSETSEETPAAPEEQVQEEEPSEDHSSDGPTMPLTRELPSEQLPALPNQLGSGADMSARSQLPSQYGPQPVFRFPFAPGARWGISGSHADSDGIHRGAIDFAPLSSSAKAVRAIASGQVYRVRCAGGWFLGIDHGGGWMSEYYHLSGARSSLIGKWVEAGTILGDAGQTLPCGGTPGTSAHVHLSILNSSVDVPSGRRQYIPVDGIQFDRYRLMDTDRPYYGIWKDFAGSRVLISRRVTCCLTADDRVGPATPRAVLPDANGNGIDDRAEITPWDSDLNGDGGTDLVGFGSGGVLVSLSRGDRFGATERKLTTFGTSDGWSTSAHLRMVMDANGDGRPDIVGFGDAGVYIAVGNGAGGFGPVKRWSSRFVANTGWSLSRNIRTLADVTGDGRPDLLGFNASGVMVSRNAGSRFEDPRRWVSEFGSSASAGGWDVADHLRLVGDVTGDGKADIVGFGERGVQVGVSTGSRFREPVHWSSSFGRDYGWRVELTPRYLADMNDDGRLDIVGFRRDGVYVALSTGSSFTSPSKWSGSFGLDSSSAGWRVDRDPRVVTDIDGDGRPDIVGFRQDGVYVARNTGSSLAAPRRWTTDFGSREWTLGVMPRAVVDVNGDGRADIVGFARHGVHVALNDGSRFRAAAHWSPDFGWGSSTGDWQVRTKPRAAAG